MFPEISRRCVSCGAAVRAQARFCSQCGQTMGEEVVKQAEKTAAEGPVTAPPVAEKTSASEEIRLKESWRRWEESLDGRVETKEEEGKTDGETAREDEAEVSVPAPELSAPAPPPTPDAPREPEGPQTTRIESPGATTVRNAAPLTRPLSETGRRRAAVVKDAVLPRVERVRERSLVVLEEAAENTGLRFVLIALALFLIFLFFLYLNDKIK
jgi:hypothetical protein